jgi:hypothetical protein
MACVAITTHNTTLNLVQYFQRFWGLAKKISIRDRKGRWCFATTKRINQEKL